jgi:hypothetical protein
MKDRNVKQVLSMGRYQWEGLRHKERVKEDTYGESILYPHMKIEQ